MIDEKEPYIEKLRDLKGLETFANQDF